MKLALYILLSWNLLAFLMHGWDKLCAIRDRRRVRERTLLGVAFLAGALGAWTGSLVFRPKIRTPRYYWPLRAAVAVNLLCFGAAAYLWFLRS